ncbi:MAG: transposase [Candidatus Wolfebacteria bacterium]|nr:transposase [Candidatus Wolfebacteria bacterium]
MKILRKLYTTIQRTLFPMLEEEIGELTETQKFFAAVVEMIKPSRFITPELSWSGQGRPMKEREYVLRAFILKAIYNFPTTKLLIENLKTNPTLRRLCGWEYGSKIPSEATFSRIFTVLAETQLPNEIHKAMIEEHHKAKLAGHNSSDSTAVNGREKSCRKNTPKAKVKKKRGRKSKAELAAINELEQNEIKTRRLELQGNRPLNENLDDLPAGCDWGAKRNSQGKQESWKGYKLHVSTVDGGIPVAAILTSASVHDSQAAIPLMQMSKERLGFYCYDLMDSAYDAKEIHDFSRNMGRVPIIDPNKRRGDEVPLEPAKKMRYNERTAAERTNSDLKDNHGGKNIRVKGNSKVFCHLMFGVIAITAKQLFNMLL